MTLDLATLRHLTRHRPATAPQLRVRLRVPVGQHAELVEELRRPVERGTLRLRRIEDRGWEIPAFEWGGE